MEEDKYFDFGNTENIQRGCILYLTLPLILSVNKAIESAPTALNLTWAGLADTCRHLLNSADLLSLLSLENATYWRMEGTRSIFGAQFCH